MTILRYNPLLKKIIKSVKYRLATEVLGELLLNLGTDALGKLAFYKHLGLLPRSVIVPLHRAKARQRGFNQARYVEAFLQSLLPVDATNALTRRIETRAQATMKRGLARHRNVAGAFMVVSPEKVKGRTIILIDDIVTTGATVKEAARTLKRAGAAKVYVFALAKG